MQPAFAAGGSYPLTRYLFVSPSHYQPGFSGTARAHNRYLLNTLKKKMWYNEGLVNINAALVGKAIYLPGMRKMGEAATWRT
jgi:hypothetical protein